MSAGDASFRDPFTPLFQQIKRGQEEAVAALSFQAIVETFITTPSAPSTATVTRLGQPESEGPYRVVPIITTLAAGDRVLVQDVTGEGGFVITMQLP